MVQKIKELTGGGTSNVTCYATLNGKLSGGTVGTCVRMHRLGLADQLSDPFFWVVETMFPLLLRI